MRIVAAVITAGAVAAAAAPAVHADFTSCDAGMTRVTNVRADPDCTHVRTIVRGWVASDCRHEATCHPVAGWMCTNRSRRSVRPPDTYFIAVAACSGLHPHGHMLHVHFTYTSVTRNTHR